MLKEIQIAHEATAAVSCATLKRQNHHNHKIGDGHRVTIEKEREREKKHRIYIISCDIL